jgi:Brp/Blh family beta-carotene 15,15'-monooxygenase
MSPIAAHTKASLRNRTSPPTDERRPSAGFPAPASTTSIGREHLVRVVPYAGLIATAALGFVDRDLSVRYDTLPFLLSFLFLGMPHGAMDWVVNQRLRRARGQSTGMRGFAWYLALMAAASTALWLAPVATIVAFLVLTIFHWGLGDIDAVDPKPRPWGRSTIGVLGRGLVVLGAAFAADPAASWHPFGLLSNQAANDTGLTIARQCGVGGLAVGLVLTTICVTLRWRVGERRGAFFDGVEVGLIAVAIAVTDPLFGIGMYFLAVHSWRHSIRLASTSQVLPEGMAGCSLGRRLGMVHLLALPLLIPTFAVLLGWSHFQFGSLGRTDLTVTMLGFFLITTLPHHLLGLRLPSPPLRSP